MASNTKLTMDHDREIAEFAVMLKTNFKRHMPGEFHDCSWVFWSRHCLRKGARRVEERKNQNEDDETGFSPFPGSSV